MTEIVKTFGVCMTPSLLEQLDKLRQDVPRSKFIVRLVEKNLQTNDENKSRVVTSHTADEDTNSRTTKSGYV